MIRNDSFLFCSGFDGPSGHFPQQFLYFLPLPQGQGAFLAGLPETVGAFLIFPFTTAARLASGF